MALDDDIERLGMMFVLSGPSGAGVTTLSRLLIERIPRLQVSVSVTTRPMRPGEIDGRDYQFVDRARFEEMVKRKELLEWATVFDNRYGTPRAPVEAALSAGQDVLFDIDWQGTQQLRETARQDVVSVFILPPSTADLEKRLHIRAQDSQEVIQARMSRAGNEMSHWAEYDYIVVNRDLDEAFAEVQSILKAERLKRERRIGLRDKIRAIGTGVVEITNSPPDRETLTADADTLSADTVETSPSDLASADQGAGVVALTATSHARVTGGALPSSEPRGGATHVVTSNGADAAQLREAAFESLQARVAVLEATLLARPAGIGHNRGPNNDNEPGVDEDEIQAFISRLKDQRATAPVELPKLIEAARVADPAVNKWRERLDDFVKGALKGAGFATGKIVGEKLVRAAWVHSVYSALEAVYESLKHWLTWF